MVEPLFFKIRSKVFKNLVCLSCAAPELCFSDLRLRYLYFISPALSLVTSTAFCSVVLISTASECVFVSATLSPAVPEALLIHQIFKLRQLIYSTYNQYSLEKFFCQYPKLNWCFLRRD